MFNKDAKEYIAWAVFILSITIALIVLDNYDLLDLAFKAALIRMRHGLLF